jgi:hypothetical protein
MRGMLERGEITVEAVPHGFRASFRDWAAEQTPYPDEIRKAASGHILWVMLFRRPTSAKVRSVLRSAENS